MGGKKTILKDFIKE